MNTYSLLQFLTQPLDHILDNDENYCFEIIASPTISKNKADSSISSITIPIIQRDYAQGRAENTELREEFIKKLFKHLESEQQIKLDFIYGSIYGDKGNSFLPLDGQQRLTTLFLLHWYIIKVETKNTPEDFDRYREILSKFSYETRDTSRRFFKELIDFEFEGNPKKEIEKAYWFNDNFSLDPTIKGALNTVETIHQIYKSKEERKLIKSLDAIVFYVLPMDQFKLTDDLYIKLNARGKALSSFENFKADLIGFIKDVSVFEKVIEMDNGIILNHYDIIANKLDNTWSDLFWREAKKHLNDNENKSKISVDAYFFRFLHRLIINDYIVAYRGSDINKDAAYRELIRKESELYYTNFELYKTNNLITTGFVKNLEFLLDFYSRFNTQIQQYINPLWDKPALKYSIYRDGNYTMDDRMVFDAVNLYILNSGNDFHHQNFKSWMRVIWNLISDPDIRSIEANKTVMTVIRNIAAYANDIYNTLANNILDAYIYSLNNIHKEQLLEEKQKAILILKNKDEWEKAIQKAESHKLYEGNIGFLLSNIQSGEQLNKRFETSCLFFSDKGAKELIETESHSLIRYIVSQFDNWGELQRFNFLSNEINWKTYLRRHETLKNRILKLIEIDDIEAIKIEILQSLKGDSILKEGNTKQLLAHKNLYYHDQFHQWMQKDGTYRLKWLKHYIYVVRPNAWYSKVMIDGFRNQLIKALITRFNLNKETKECNNSGFYWGETIDFLIEIGDNKIGAFHFDIKNQLLIGLKGEQNPHIEDADFSQGGWKQRYIFEIDKIKSEDEITDFVSDIELTLKNDPACLILGLLS